MRRRVLTDAMVVAVVVVATLLISVRLDLFERFADWSRSYERWSLDEVLIAVAVWHLGMMVFGIRRGTDIREQTRRRDEVERELSHRLRHDPLTGLLNRSGFETVLVTASDGHSWEHALVLVDIDRFRDVNASFGTDAGDRVLVEAATRLRNTVEPDAVLARVGTDEFAVLVPPAEPDTIVDHARRLQEVLSQPFELGTALVAIGVSVGVADTRTVGHEPQELLMAADRAKSAAQSMGATVVAYDDRLREESFRRVLLYGDLRTAIERHELLLHYQPTVSLDTGMVTGVEALARWPHPRLGLLPPCAFIGMAEDTGLVRALTSEVLDLAVSQASAWQRSWPDAIVSVNMSAASLLDVSFPDEVARCLEQHGLPPEALELELTESMAMVDPERAIRTLRSLADRGVRLAIDDYGTGHSSLAYLRRLPVQTLKIDRELVQQIASNRQDAAIVESTVALAHRLGLRVIAEGVEDEPTWWAVTRAGCDVAQGFWMSRPLPADQVVLAAMALRLPTATPSPLIR